MIARSVLVAPNAFKGSLTAVEAAAAMSAAVFVINPNSVIVVRPVADGGDGSVDALLTAGFDRLDIPVRGPTGVPRIAPIAVRGDLSVVEVANSCGLLLLPDRQPAPMVSTTLGLGDAVRGALDAHARRIVLCLGGSASTDGGSGLLVALGARTLDRNGVDVPTGGRGLAQIASLDLAGLDPRLRDVRIDVATDVANPLLGPQGAAGLFGPQKGAGPLQVTALEEGLANWARVLAATTGIDAATTPGAGAAGGTAVAALAALRAHVVSGADFLCEAIDLGAAIAEADLVLTGEGSLDEQSLLGKGAVYVARTAQAAGRPVVMVCGDIRLDADALTALGVVGSGRLLDISTDADDAVRRAAELLARRTVEVLAALNAHP